MQLRKGNRNLPPKIDHINFHMHEGWATIRKDKTINDQSHHIKPTLTKSKSISQHIVVTDNPCLRDSTANHNLSDRLNSLIKIFNNVNPNAGKKANTHSSIHPLISSIVNSKCLLPKPSLIKSCFADDVLEKHDAIFSHKINSPSNTHRPNYTPQYRPSHKKTSTNELKELRGTTLELALNEMKVNYIHLLMGLNNKEKHMMDTIINLDTRLREVQAALLKYEISK